jgi:YfiH family protein
MAAVDTAPDREVIARYREALVQSDLLNRHPAFRHGITGRVPGMEPAEGNIGYSAPRDRDAAWRERQRWARAARIDPMALSTVHQVHGREVIGIGVDRRGLGGPLGSTALGRADAIMTATPGVAVMTLHADCLPIILADPDVPAVAAIHAGWRGTVVDVVGATVQAMTTEYGARPERMVVLLGPGMRSCCYEVGDEVVEAWRASAGIDGEVALSRGPRRWHFDLAIANRSLLAKAGIAADRIDDQSHCTHCNGDRWFSHRLQGPETGRFGAMVGIAPASAEEAESWV